MSNTHGAPRNRQEAGRCEFRLKGHLDGRWVGWFDGLSLTLDSDGITVIHGQVVDEAALYGVLQRVRDVGLPLVSVKYLRQDQRDVSTHRASQRLTNNERNSK
jgi:hypothetical protein